MVLFSTCQRQTFSQNLPLLLLCFWLSLTPVILCFFFKKFFSFLLFVCFLLLFLLFASNTGREQREEKFKCFRSSIYSLSHTALAYHTSDGDKVIAICKFSSNRIIQLLTGKSESKQARMSYSKFLSGS